MTLEEILNTDVYTALSEGTMVEEELNCQDEEKERLPNISTLLRALEFDLGIINNRSGTDSKLTVDVRYGQDRSKPFRGRLSRIKYF